MNWNLEGKKVNGLYMGLFPYSGLVTENRVGLSGEIQYAVELDQSIEIFGSMRDRILVGISEIFD